MRRVWVVVAGVVLVAAGLGGVVAGGHAGEASARRVGANAPINPSATDRLDESAHNSPSLAANPRDARNLAEAERVQAPVPSCAVRVSLDAGASWSAVPVDLPGGEAVSCYWPSVAFGADGTLYFAFTTFGEVPGEGNAPDGVWLARSGDQGRSFSAPARAYGALASEARLAASPVDAGRIWLSWLQVTGTTRWGLSSTGNPVMVARSDDGGSTWGAPVRASRAGRARVVSPALAPGAGGLLHLAYLDVGDDRLDYEGGHEGNGGEPYQGRWSLVMARSTDLGATWTDTVVDAKVVPTRRFLLFSPPAPAIATDVRRGRVYVAFEDGRLGNADVWLWAGDGRRWRAPRRVNDTPPRDRTTQTLPALGVAPGGRLDVVYYDRRADRHDVRTGVSLQSSFDAGRSFTAAIALSDRRFDSGIGPGSERGMPDLGDRLGVVSTDGGALAVWADTRAAVGSKQDVARAVAAVRRPSPMRPWWRAAGLLVAVLGAVIAVLGLTRRRAPGPPAPAGDLDLADEVPAEPAFEPDTADT